MPPPSQFAAYINTQQTIFSEDFRATQFNYRDPFDQASTGLWRADYGHGGQQGLASYTLNDEKQLYVSSYFRDMDMPINPFSMDGESLTITARKRAPDDGLDAAFTINGVEYQYSSGAITTAPSENGSQGSLFEYGYFEMRAQLPTAAGAFPAFWLLPTENHGTDPNHPPEIDIMEQIGNKQAYWGTVHPGVDHPHTGNNQPMIDPSSGYATSGEIVTNGLPDLSGWHTYGLLWTPEKLVWTFDGVSKFEAPTPSLFDSPMYILANLALGGWGGAVNDAQLPASMNIDYIKVWDYAPKDPAGMTLKADSFRHSLAGYTGADTLVGGLGQDSMTGGAGADVFRFDLAPLQAANIGDFAAAEDKIDLRAALARDGYFGADPLLDQRVLVSTANGVTTVSYDRDGAGGAPADVIANLAGAPVLGSANFLGSAPVGATGVSVAADYHHVVLGTSGADTLIGGGSGQDVMVGGVGADRFAFTADHVPWTPSRILDFTRGADKIDIAAPLAKVGYTGSDPFATGHLRQEEAPGIGTRLIFDSDGPGQQDVWGQFFLVLDDVTAGSLTGADLIITGAPPPPPPPTGGDEIHARFANDTLVGGSGADTLFGSQGSDLMTGGGGADVFRWENEPWSPATVTDFHLGEDRIDLSVLFQKAGFSGADPIAAHYISLLQQDGDTLILFDRDADATAQQWPNYIIKLDDFQEANLTWAQLAGSGSPPPPPPPGQDLWSQHPDDTLTGGAGNDTLHASRGQDLLTGGGGDDIFAWAEEAWAPAVITDFDPGNDKLDFRALFDQAGYYGATPFQDGYLSVIGDGADGTKVLYDRDAAGSGQQWPNYILHIEHVAPGAISSSDFLVQ